MLAKTIAKLDQDQIVASRHGTFNLADAYIKEAKYAQVETSPRIRRRPAVHLLVQRMWACKLVRVSDGKSTR